jgi:arylsulfatase A-like enzyme
MDPKRSTLVLVSDHGFKTADQPVALYPAHSEYGVLMGWGSQVKRGQSETAEPRDLDVAPTIYALLGLPVGGDMNGRILSEHFETPSKTTVLSYATASTLLTAARPVDFQRLPELQALGYVDEEGRPLDAVVPSQPQGGAQ